MNKMILVDLETQDFAVEAGIYEVSCLVLDNYQVVDRLYLGNKIEGYNGPTTYGKGFHDISNNNDYVSKFKEFIGKHNLPLVAHNCSFDRKFLLHYNWIDEDYPCYCSITAFKKEVPGLPSYSLANLVEHFKIQSKNSHTASSDTEALLELIRIIKPKSWRKMGKPKARSKSASKGYSVDAPKPIKVSLVTKIFVTLFVLVLLKSCF